MRLDIYTWLTYRMSYLKSTTTIPWKYLQGQPGVGYPATQMGLGDFQKKAFLEHPQAVRIGYTQARVDVTDRGLWPEPSREIADYLSDLPKSRRTAFAIAEISAQGTSRNDCSSCSVSDRSAMSRLRSTSAISSRLRNERPSRSSFHTTKVSPARSSPSARSDCGREGTAPPSLSWKIRWQPATLSASSCRRVVCSSVETRA